MTKSVEIVYGLRNFIVMQINLAQKTFYKFKK